MSDFGLANLLVDDEAYVTTVVAGTFGYLAPGQFLLFVLRIGNSIASKCLSKTSSLSV